MNDGGTNEAERLVELLGARRRARVLAVLGPVALLCLARNHR